MNGPQGPTGATGPAGAQGPAGVISTTGWGGVIAFQNPGGETVNTVYFFNPSTAFTSVNGTPTIADHGTVSGSADTPNYILSPGACTLVSLGLGVNNTRLATSATITATVYINGNATTMTTSVSVNGTSAVSTDTTHTQAVAAGDRVSIGWKDTANGGVDETTITLNCR